MALSLPIPSQLVAFIILSHTMFSLRMLSPYPNQLPNNIPPFEIASKLRNDPNSIRIASNDYGNLVQQTPSAVFYPSSINDIVNLIKYSNNCSTPFSVSARGRGHSVRGQAMACNGVVVDMPSLISENGGVGIRIFPNPNPLGYNYADVGGEQMWIDVLRASLEYGLSPVSWTDYLYLSVGGTLSNAGISGQSFMHGPQISNVLELDVITGKGDLIACSHYMNSELFFAVLGGLGQFGIITRARIRLHKAPTRAKWVRLLYSDFSTFTSDQEHLIISTSNNTPDYVEGSLITNQSPPNNWRSSFYSPSHRSKIASLLNNSNKGLLYSIELVKYYDDQTAHTIDEDLQLLLKDLKFIPGFIFKKDVPLIDFLARVKNTDDEKNSGEGPREVEAHPWLNLFVPKSRIVDFNAGVFDDIIGSQSQTSPGTIILFYPLNRKKWDGRMSAVTPDDDIFYTVGLLHSSRGEEWEKFDRLNNEIIKFCEKGGISIKQYLPHYKSEEDWMKHYGPKWETFKERKSMFDPRMILSPGQRIFTSLDHYSDI